MSASSKKKLRKEQAAAKLTEKQQKEKVAAKKLKITTIVFSVVMILLLVITLTSLIFGAVNRSGVLQKNIIAAKVGDHELNSVEFNYYFIDSLNSTYNFWVEEYGDYLDFYMQVMGIDFSQPLSSQVKDSTTQETWADYFVQYALENAQNNYALADAATAEGFTLSEEQSSSIDTQMKSMLVTATLSGYGSINDYLEAIYGYGADETTYRAYVERSYLATEYYNAHEASLTYDDAAIEAYDAENPGSFDTYTYSSYTVNYSDFLVGGTKDEKGNVSYSEEEKAVAKEVAEKLAKELTACTTLEELNAAIAELPFTVEKTTTPTATSFENAYSYDINTTYKEWLTAPERKAGDSTYFTNEASLTNEDGTTSSAFYGYFVVLLEEVNDNTRPLANVRHLLVQPSGGTTDANGNIVYSDKELYEAKCRAEVLLAEWEAGERTEESFIALLKEKSADTASLESGGLYEDISPDSGYAESFEAWAIDPARQVGDVGIIKSQYGYHIMYFSSFDELCYRDVMISATMRTEDMYDWYSGLVTALSIELCDLSQVNTDIILFR